MKIFALIVLRFKETFDFLSSDQLDKKVFILFYFLLFNEYPKVQLQKVNMRRTIPFAFKSVFNLLINSAGADGGPRSRVCARLTLHSAPHRHQRKCFWGGVNKIFLSIFSPLKGARGGPQKFVSPQILFFCDWQPHAKFENPTITPSGRKVTAAERREKKRRKTRH